MRYRCRLSRTYRHTYLFHFPKFFFKFLNFYFFFLGLFHFPLISRRIPDDSRFAREFLFSSGLYHGDLGKRRNPIPLTVRYGAILYPDTILYTYIHYGAMENSSPMMCNGIISRHCPHPLIPLDPRLKSLP